MKKNICMAVIAVLMLITMLCTGCNGNANRNEKIVTSYPEWIEAMNPELENNKIYEYEETSDGVTLIINNPPGDDYLAILDKHTDFVIANPDYFPRDFKIVFGENSGGMVSDYFTNRSNVTDEIKVDENFLLKYAFIEGYGLYSDTISSNAAGYHQSLANVEVLEINLVGGCLDGLSLFPKLKTLYLYPRSFQPEQNIDHLVEMLPEINAKYPSVDVASGNKHIILNTDNSKIDRWYIKDGEIVDSAYTKQVN